MAAFFIAGVFSAIYLSGGFLDSRGVLCHISEWRRFFIAGVFSAMYPSGGIFHSRGVVFYISEWRLF